MEVNFKEKVIVYTRDVLKKPVNFEYEFIGTYHAPQFRCNVQCNGIIITGDYESSKIKACQNACGIYCAKIIQLTSKVMDVDNYVNGINYKGNLITMCQVNKAIYPTVDYVVSGPINRPIYTAKVIFEGKTYTSICCSKKKECEQSVCQRILADYTSKSLKPMQKIYTYEEEDVLIMSDAEKDINLFDTAEDEVVVNKIDSSRIEYPHIDNLKEKINVDSKRVSYNEIKIFDEKLNYINMLVSFAINHAYVFPKYQVMSSMIGRKTYYSGQVKFSNVHHISVKNCNNVVEACNHAAWTCLETLSELQMEGTWSLDLFLVDFSSYYIQSKTSFPRDVWLKILTFMDPTVILPLKLVCKTFYAIITTNDFWRNYIDPEDKIKYHKMIREYRSSSFAFGNVFSMGEFLTRRQLGFFGLKKLNSLVADYSKYKCDVVVSTVKTCFKNLFQCKTIFGTEVVEGISASIEYTDNNEIRRANDPICGLKKKQNLVSFEPYVVSRNFIYDRCYCGIGDFPGEESFRYALGLLVNSCGGGTEVQFVTDPYWSEWVSFIIVYLPFVGKLIEVGCESYCADAYKDKALAKFNYGFESKYAISDNSYIDDMGKIELNYKHDPIKLRGLENLASLASNMSKHGDFYGNLIN